MGSKFEVFAWEQTEHGDYAYFRYYADDSFGMAIYTAWRLKRRGVGCVRIEWR